MSNVPVDRLLVQFADISILQLGSDGRIQNDFLLAAVHHQLAQNKESFGFLDLASGGGQILCKRDKQTSESRTRPW